MGTWKADYMVSFTSEPAWWGWLWLWRRQWRWWRGWWCTCRWWGVFAEYLIAIGLAFWCFSSSRMFVSDSRRLLWSCMAGAIWPCPCPCRTLGQKWSNTNWFSLAFTMVFALPCVASVPLWRCRYFSISMFTVQPYDAKCSVSPFNSFCKSRSNNEALPSKHAI